jgi:hypothetical protein
MKLAKIKRITKGKYHCIVRMMTLRKGDLFIKEGSKSIWKAVGNPFINKERIATINVKSIDIIKI